jgi:hypothetical protein
MKNLLNYVFSIVGVISFMNVLFTILLYGITNEAIAWSSSGIMGLTAQHFFNLSKKEEE